MNFQNLLNQVLDGVQKTAGDKNLLGKIGGGAAAVGLASMLLGKKTRKNLLKTGSSAALGALAYHAYQNWQQSRNAAGGQTAQSAPLLAQNAFEPQGEQAQNAGRLILKTMIAAAAADGSIDETERSLIEQESGGSEESQWLLAETRNPAAPAELAALAGGDTAAAAEAYLAARMVCGELSRKEIVFLSQLADAFRLDPQLVEQLERQAGF